MKHAFLIMAHNNFEQLRLLIEAIDDERNDIYIHVDIKAKDFNANSISTKNAGLYWIERKSITWGGYSQIDCELRLLNAAINSSTNYKYYHLLSGIDLPIKSQDYIHKFFDEHESKQYIGYQDKLNDKDLDRIKYYWVFQEQIGRRKKVKEIILYLIQIIFVKLQMFCNLKRKHDFITYKGDNWFSITHDFALYVIENSDFIKKEFSCSICADELFLHTLCKISPYCGDIANDSLREIDWDRGFPYTYTIDDFDMLMSSKKLFARKFDINMDKEIVYKIFESFK